jgi:hypothetical protein
MKEHKVHNRELRVGITLQRQQQFSFADAMLMLIHVLVLNVHQ